MLFLHYATLVTLIWMSCAQASVKEVKEIFEPKPLDGVMVQAVENYPNPGVNTFGLGVGIYPFNAYYTSVSVNLNYQYNFNRSLSWEVVNGSYAFSYKTSLTTELADNFAVNPAIIDYLRFLVSSNLLYTIANGKFVSLGDSIRFFKAVFLFGPGYVNTSLSSSLAVNFGLQFEFFTSGSIGWRFDVRDNVTFSGNNVLIFALSSGIHF